MKKVLILTNSVNGLYSFRRELIEKLTTEYKVIISAPKSEKTKYFCNLGCTMINTKINGRGTNPLEDIKLFLNYIKMIRNVKPDIVLTYTIKPNVYGGLASKILKVPYIANITGLGSSIQKKQNLIRGISLYLYKIGLKSAQCVFVQNQSIYDFMLKNSLVNGKLRLIPGSGVNVTEYRFEQYPQERDSIKFLFIGRILRDKGVEELFKVIKKIKSDYKNIEFHIVGNTNDDYKTALKELESKGLLNYHGRIENIHNMLKESHAIIHPSHHEGMSNVLLEAASTGRPILASNIPGCKETFDEGVSGLGFEAKNIESLYETIIKFIKIPYAKKREMGVAGRIKMEKEFDRNIVINAYMEEINQTLKER